MTTDSATPFVGRPMPRQEDERFLRGRGVFVDDLELPGMLHLAFKRSDVAHGRIGAIRADAALAIPGVVAVFTGEDLRHLALVPVLSPFPAPDHRPLAVDKVCYVGDPIAVVVAEDRYAARDGLDALEVEVEELPAVVDPERALDGDPTLVHDDFPNNIALHIAAGTGVDPETGEADDTEVDATFARADVVISQRMDVPRIAPTAIETRGCVAQYDAGRDSLTIWTTTQRPHTHRRFVAEAVGLPEDRVRTIMPDMGGGFGAKKIYGEDFVAAHLARELRRPVKWIEDRSESFLTTTYGRGMVGYIDIAARKDGVIQGVKARLIQDIGAYEMLLTAFIPTLTHGMLSSQYAIPVIRSELFEVFTNKMSTDAYRGAGMPEALFFIERGIDMLARELGIDPAEIRRRNFIPPDQFPYETAGGNTYDSGEYERALDLLLENAGWPALIAARDAARAEGRLVGLGIASYVELCGIGPSWMFPSGGWEYGSVTVERNGRVTATTGAASHGQGHETSFAQILADEFGIQPQDVTLVYGDTGRVRQGVGTVASRSLVVGGTALRNAAGEVREQMSRFVAHMLEVQETDLVFAQGQISLANSPEISIPFQEVAAYAYQPPTLPRGAQPGLSAEAFWEPEGITFPFGHYLVQLEIDRDTGEITLQKFIGVDDCGTVVNPLIVAGQIQGGIAQGIGPAMTEEAVYDEDGQLLTGSFLDYAIPRASDLPQIELDYTVTPTHLNPLGAKGVGEAGTIGSTPAVANAVVDALSEFGVKHVDLMLRPEKIWRLMQKAQGGALD